MAGRHVLTVRVVLRLLCGVSSLAVRLGGLLLQLRQAAFRRATSLLRLVVGILVLRDQCIVVPQPPAHNSDILLPLP